ncbi:sensor domain-containing diguanylate cyclase [Meiothermus sp.]|uniref:GGDEF domain-containing protein n=1 Tax=Meiothermus sp. TaxID=1955249 RepID=UPI0021DBF94E|nr:sensor domain-containing diguanylate cyclase [Meiothermus sp.]GIW33173.1 MAG: GGDEF domain-containing protein [Meiothermus sp.]
MTPQAILEDIDPTAPLRARAYFFILPVVVWAALFAWSQLDIAKEETFYEKYSLLIMAIWLGLCWIGLLIPRWVNFHTVEHGVFWSAALLMVLNVYYNLLVVSSEGLWNSSLWIAVVFVMAYFVFKPRQAWLVSLGIFSAFVFLGLLTVVPQTLQGIPLDQNAVVQLYVSQLCYLILFRLLVLSKEHSMQVRLEAARLYWLAHTDPLTNIANRRSIMEALHRALEHHQKTGEPLSLVLLDLDYFKRINDQYGHEMGDKVLTHTAQVLQQNLRQSDQLGRWGGEEFVILLPNTPLQEARKLCERLQTLLAENTPDRPLPVSASFGVATAAPDDTPDSLISRADTAMYMSKQAGGNRVEVAG